jgi:uncharacterized coiled-coil DUF342 family protein
LFNLVYNKNKHQEHEIKAYKDIIENLKSEINHTKNVNQKKHEELTDLNNQHDDLRKKYDKVSRLTFGRLEKEKK